MASTPENQYKPDRENPVTAHGLVMWQAVEKVPLGEWSWGQHSIQRKSRTEQAAGPRTVPLFRNLAPRFIGSSTQTGVRTSSSAFYCRNVTGKELATVAATKINQTATR